MNTVAKSVLMPFTLFLALIYGYVQLAAWNEIFEIENFFSQWVELGMVAYLCTYLYQIQKPGRARVLLAAAPVILAYLAQDLFFHFYGKVLRIIEVLELPELFAVLPLSYGVLLAAVFLLPLLALLHRIDFSRWLILVLGALPIVALVTMVETRPRLYTGFLESSGNEIIKYSDSMSVENNGRLTMLLYREAQRIEALAATEPYRNPADYDHQGDNFAALLKASSSQHNVHVIVLESFLDPTLFRDASFNRDPTHPDFRKLFGDQEGFSISPVFGGATAQAEFEVLCGVPAFEKLTSVEFNLFTGSPTNCVPGILHRMGYRTVATNAYKPNFFNAQPAYKGIGFQEIYFPREFAGSNPTYFEAGNVDDEYFMFDGDLFEQNLQFVSQHLREHPGQPLMNYIMTIYGHTPHMTNDAKRPPVIKISGPREDRHLALVANQYYYRSQAIARYVARLREMDPNSLVILVADHVPPLVYGPITYRELGYMGNQQQAQYHNRLMVVEDGVPKRYSTIHHYNLPQVMFNYLTAGQYCRNQACAHLGKRLATEREQYLPRYYQLMAHASL